MVSLAPRLCYYYVVSHPIPILKSTAGQSLYSKNKRRVKKRSFLVGSYCAINGRLLVESTHSRFPSTSMTSPHPLRKTRPDSLYLTPYMLLMTWWPCRDIDWHIRTIRDLIAQMESSSLASQRYLAIPLLNITNAHPQSPWKSQNVLLRVFQENITTVFDWLDLTSIFRTCAGSPATRLIFTLTSRPVQPLRYAHNRFVQGDREQLWVIYSNFHLSLFLAVDS
jgi:hypothetical protein